jgi:hypothetical protein
MQDQVRVKTRGKSSRTCQVTDESQNPMGCKTKWWSQESLQEVLTVDSLWFTISSEVDDVIKVGRLSVWVTERLD